MGTDVQMTVFIVACLCIAVFVTSLAVAGLGYNRDANQLMQSALFAADMLMLITIMTLTWNFLVIVFTIVVALAGYAVAAILHYLFGVPVVRGVPEAAKAVRQPG